MEQLKASTGNKKWVRRGELERERVKQIEEQEAKLETPIVEEPQAKKRKLDDPLGPAIVKRTDEELAQDAAIIVKLSHLSDAHVFRRLRALELPIRLFGEEKEQRLLRLHRAELDRPEVESEGVGNEFADLMRRGVWAREPEVPMPSVRGADRAEEFPSKEGGDRRQSEPRPETKLDKRTEDDELEKKRIHMLAIHPDNPQWTREQSIRYFFKHLLAEWEQYLEGQRDKLKPTDSMKIGMNKRDFVILEQTKQYLKPLMRQLKDRTLDPVVESALGDIMDATKAHEYQKAHDHYISIAIGKAAWPIGVTMTGIHERSAREKIQQNQVAHILNDEKARKYLQAVKRLLTFCQIRYPTDPSKSFEYHATLFETE